MKIRRKVLPVTIIVLTDEGLCRMSNEAFQRKLDHQMSLHANVPKVFCAVVSNVAQAIGKARGFLKGVGPNHVVISFKLSFSTFKSVYFQYFVPILK